MKWLTFIIIFFLFVPLLTLNFTVKAQSEWVLETKGENFDIFYNSINSSQKQWVSAPQRVQDSSGDWVDYVYGYDKEKKCYVIQTGLIAGLIFESGYASFWTPDLSDERVKSEVWQVWAYDGKEWKQASLNSPITFDVVQNSTGVYVTATRTTSKPNGELQIVYWFRVGEGLKHFVYWRNNEESKQVVDVHQVWDVAESVKKCEIAEAKIAQEVTKSGTYDAAQFKFYDEANNFLVLEDQSAMFEKLSPTNIDFAGKKVSYTFSNWTLSQNEMLEIDPDTSTFSPPTKDTYIYTYPDGDDNFGSETLLQVYSYWYSFRYNARILIEFDISSIPEGSTINSAELQLYCSLADGPERTLVFQRINETWSETVVTWNNQPTVASGSVLNDAPQSVGWYNFSVGWYSHLLRNIVQDARDAGSTCGVRIKDYVETDFTYPNVRVSQFRSKEYAGTEYDPKLKVVYTPPPVYITLETTNPTGLQVRIDEGTWYDAPHIFEVVNGSSHSIECNPVQSGGTRTQYLWVSWNDSGANPHNVAPTANTTYVATYKTQYKVYIQSYPQGSDHVEFDGSPITTPYTSGWFDSGLNRSVEATNVTVTANQERYNWSSWSDSGAINHNVTIDGGAYTAYFSHEWYFKVNSLYGSPTGQEWYSDGDSTVNSAVTSPSSGHDVTGWLGTGSLTSGDTGESNTTGTFSITEYSTCTWVWSCGPTFDSFSVSDTSIKSHQVFTVSTVLSDETGYTDFVNATEELSHDVILLWENATNTFSIYADPHGYATLHGGSTKTVLTGTSIRVTWEISLNEEFPYGGVNVIEANTKVYDSTDLVGSGSRTGLFIFQEEERKGGGLPFVSPTMPSAKQFVEDIVSPTIFSLASNLVTVLLLATVGLSCVIAYHMEHPVWKILVGVFAVLASNFFLLFILLPAYPSGLSFLEPYLLRLPALELSTYPLGTQSLLQFIVVGALIPAFIVPIMLVAYRNE